MLPLPALDKGVLIEESGGLDGKIPITDPKRRGGATALHIDHIADKAKFAIEMLESALKGFDTIEKEIVDASQSESPSRESIRAFAYRIDTHQKQLQDGLSRLKIMMDDIDKVTDTIQRPKTSW